MRVGVTASVTSGSWVMGSARVVALVVVVLKGWVGGGAEDCGAGGVEDVGVVDDMVWYCCGIFIDYFCRGFGGIL